MPDGATPQRPGDTAHDAGAPRLSSWYCTVLLSRLYWRACTKAAASSVASSSRPVTPNQGDYLVLNLYQVEMEYLRLREQLRKDIQVPDHKALQLRYDIFVSRVSISTW